MTWADLLDICKQRRTERWPGGKTGPMFNCSFRGGMTFKHSVWGQSERLNGPSQIGLHRVLSNLIGPA